MRVDSYLGSFAEKSFSSTPTLFQPSILALIQTRAGILPEALEHKGCVPQLAEAHPSLMGPQGVPESENLSPPELINIGKKCCLHMKAQAYKATESVLSYLNSPLLFT